MKILAIDIGGSAIKYALVDSDGNMSQSDSVPTPLTSLDDLLLALDTVVVNVNHDFEGIAISMPGKIDAAKKIAHTGGMLQYISNLNIGEIIEQRYNTKMVVENDGKSAISAEKWLGCLQHEQNAMVLVLGSGIGGGLLINNQIYKGSTFAAGEVSLFLANIREFKMENIWAMINSTTGLLNMYNSVAEDKVDNGKEFFKRLYAGDEIASNTLGQFGMLFANAIFAFQSILDLEAYAIGGGISTQPVLVETIEKCVDGLFANLPGMPVSKPKIKTCKFYNDANLLGAAKLYFDTYK